MVNLLAGSFIAAMTTCIAGKQVDSTSELLGVLAYHAGWFHPSVLLCQLTKLVDAPSLLGC